MPFVLAQAFTWPHREPHLTADKLQLIQEKRNVSGSKNSIAYLGGKRFSFPLPKTLIRALPNTDPVAKRLFRTWADVQPILIFTKQKAAASNMVDNRLKFLMDLQINMSLEERGRKWERGMIISSNLRGTPQGSGGYIRDKQYPSPAQQLFSLNVVWGHWIGNRTEPLNPQVKQSFIVCSVKPGREMHLGCVSAMQRWSDYLLFLSVLPLESFCKCVVGF